MLFRSAASDGPEHVHAALVAHARGLLAKAGVEVAEGVDVELDSASILDDRDVAAAIGPGTRIERPTIVRNVHS